MPLNEGAINEIIPFCTEGLESAGDILSLEAYKTHEMRKRGHMPGMALRELQNREARQATHMAAGLAQFIANRYGPGVVDDADLDKIEEGLAQAVMKLAYEDRIGQYDWFEDTAERPGWFVLQGGVVKNISNYPLAVKYFSTPAGAARLVTQAQWDAAHVAVHYTYPDGRTETWAGIGGVDKFVWDKTADTLRLHRAQHHYTLCNNSFRKTSDVRSAANCWPAAKSWRCSSSARAAKRILH
jgi:hypothetical protein